MSITNPVKKISASKIGCDGEFDLTLGITATPDIAAKPMDLVMILDRSGSMRGRFDKLQNGAKNLIDTFSSATGGVAGQTIGGGSRIGLVSFSTEAAIEHTLTTDAAALKANVDNLVVGGITNHADAFQKAISLFDSQSVNDKAIMMFTDGAISDGDDPDPIVEAAKAQGIIIYCVGIGSTKNVLDKWATDPNDQHVAWSANNNDIEKLFASITSEIVKAGIIDGTIREILSPDFAIISVGAPSNGVVVKTSANSLSWDIGDLGAAGEESASLTFRVKHISKDGGTKQVNQSLVYNDEAGNNPVFPNPTIEVECSEMAIITEPCPVPVDFQMAGCQDSIIIDMDNVELSSLGRIVQINTTIKNVCPNKRVAVAVQLNELSADGQELPRGLKVFTVPAHGGESCADVEVKCIKFVLPEDMDPTNPASLCNARNFKARVMANYVDTDFVCCPDATV